MVATISLCAFLGYSAESMTCSCLEPKGSD
jgi:hypothetical protein